MKILSRSNLISGCCAGILLAAAVTAGCSNVSTPVAPGISQSNVGRPAKAVNPDALKTGLYANNQGSLLAFPINNEKNHPAKCTSPFTITGPMQVDHKGNVLAVAPNHTIAIGAGPGVCGTQLGTLTDPYGLPSDVASNDAASGKIAIANFSDNGSCSNGPCPGSLTVCTLAAGCTKNLTNGNIYVAYGIAMDPKGNCFVSGENANGPSTLTYFAKCAGSGVLATGFQNFSGGDGGLEIDKAGNIIAVARVYGSQSAVYVYSGCKPACTLLGGPFVLSQGRAAYAHLNNRGNTLAVASYVYRRVDIYAYTPTSLTYEYSFSNGFGNNQPSGVAYDPAVK